MATYTVPQDVEADDKLIGPFSFRQFVYLMVSAGLCFVAFVLFQIFPLLVIIPIPIIIFLVVLALPLKKDQPMETYLSALVDFYLKPKSRVWMPGQSDISITVTAPKVVEKERTRDISREEASRRLSFLAEIADTEGRSIKDGYTEDTQDMFDFGQNTTLEHSLEQSEDARRAQLIQQMRQNINGSTNEPTTFNQVPTATAAGPSATPMPVAPIDISTSSATIQPDMEEIHSALAQKENEKETNTDKYVPELNSPEYVYEEPETTDESAVEPTNITSETPAEDESASIQLRPATPAMAEEQSIATTDTPTVTPASITAELVNEASADTAPTNITDDSVTISHDDGSSSPSSDNPQSTSDDQETYISLH